MRTIGCPPEADLTAVANGDLSALSQPILVAAASAAQYEEFIWEEALLCTEVRRFRAYPPAPCAEGKILLLLPGYDYDAKTNHAVDRWVNQEDRYTVQLNSPRSCIETDMARTRRSIALMVAAVLALCLWWISK